MISFFLVRSITTYNLQCVAAVWPSRRMLATYKRNLLRRFPNNMATFINYLTFDTRNSLISPWLFVVLYLRVFFLVYFYQKI